MKNRDITILLKMIEYADNISDTVKSLGLDYCKFKQNLLARTAISMWVLQIGELARKLTDEFRAEHSGVPWRDIVATRNKAAHAYEAIDWDTMWEIVSLNITELRAYCDKILQERES